MKNYSERQHTVASTGSTFREHFITDGFAFPVSVLSTVDAIGMRRELETAEATDIVLSTGQASFHHGHLFHASGPNNSDDRRIGVAIRLIKPSMEQRGSERLTVTQIAGTDKFDHFTHGYAPRGFLHEVDFQDARAERDLRNTIMFAGAAEGS